MDALLVLLLVVAAMVLLVTERLRADMVAMAVLAALILLRIVGPAEALSGFSQYVGRHKDDVEAVLTFAEIRRRVPKPDYTHLRHAVQLFSHVLDLEPQNLQALEGLLEIYQATSQRIELGDCADRILAIAPGHEQALQSRIFTELAVGKFDSAIQLAQRLCEVDLQRFEFQELYIYVRTQAGDKSQELESYCDELVNANPEQDGRWFMLRSNARMRNRDLEGAKEDLLAAADRGVEQYL